jgi:hypothetical protein
MKDEAETVSDASLQSCQKNLPMWSEEKKVKQ